LKFQKITPCKDLRIGEFEFVAKLDVSLQ